MAEATAVEPAGRISPFDVGLWSDEQERAFTRIAHFVSEQGAVPAIQLAHAGRKASHARPWEDRRPLQPEDGGWQVVGPSAIPWTNGDLIPEPLDLEGIAQVVDLFRHSAERALRAGFRILELHAAHGYLLHSFLSPISNRRIDSYGGTFENRARLLLETIEAVRSVWPPELPLFVRMSARDWIEEGWSVSDTIRVARMMAPLGVDLIDCSSGGTSPAESIEAHPGYQVRFAAQVRRETGLTTAAVGLLSDPLHAEEIIATEQADLIALGRILLWDPYWPRRAAAALGVDPSLPIQYERASIYSRVSRTDSTQMSNGVDRN